MQYRKMGKLDWKPSALGFGCMRFPTNDTASTSANINEDKTVSLIRHAIDNGVNYVDTAYLYHFGKSEVVLGKALKDGYRDKVKIADKAPMAIITSAEQYDKILDEQLKRLDVDFIDFYLFHAVNAKTWEIMKNEDLFARAEAAQKAGKIGHICFSFHDEYSVFEDMINSYDKWAACQIQYNFMDADYQAGMKGLKLAASKDIGVVIMEPLRGGKLANPIPQAAELMNKKGYKDTMANLALQWLWNQPEVSLVISGMNEMNQVTQNINSANNSGVGTLTAHELELVSDIKAIYDSRESIPCTGCGYCLPCPESINIPVMMEFYNDAIVYEHSTESQRLYNLQNQPAKSCIQCRECESKCPQSIKISELMPVINEKLED